MSSWIKYEGNPVFGNTETGTCFDANVIEKGTHRYNMYFSWRPQKAVALTGSEDGIRFSEPVIVLPADPSSGWEDEVNRSCTVFAQGRFFMWYTGQARGYSKIGCAASEDGIHFTRLSRMPVMTPEYPWEGFSVMNPYVLFDEKRDLFRMWYASGETYEPNVLCYAESEDALHWEKSPLNPVFVKGGDFYDRDRVGGCEVHPLEDGGCVMFYIGCEDIDTARVCAAFSKDGVTGWRRSPENPLVSPTPESWDSCACYKPAAVYDRSNDRWLLWYNGRRRNGEFIGLAVHPGRKLTGDGPEKN